MTDNGYRERIVDEGSLRKYLLEQPRAADEYEAEYHPLRQLMPVFRVTLEACKLPHVHDLSQVTPEVHPGRASTGARPRRLQT